MPNGFHNDATIELFSHRHTEHGQPSFWTYKSDRAVIAAHLEQDRGYAYEGHWGAAKLEASVRGRRTRPTRVEAAAVAAEVVEKLKAVMASNPRSVVLPTEASAFLFFDGWGVLFGDYHLYVRVRGAAFQRIEPPLSRKPDLLAALSTHPDLAYTFSRTHVAAVQGLWMHEPDQCVHDLGSIDEWIVTTAPLHEHPLWEPIARAPLDSVESAGSLVLAVREHAIEHGIDHLVIVRRCARHAGEEVVIGGRESLPEPVRSPTPSVAAPSAGADDDRGEAYLRMVWGAEVGRPFLVKSQSVLGRGGDCDVFIDAAEASRHHARIQKMDQRYLIVDLETRGPCGASG